VVALVPVAFEKVKLVRVEDADEINPLKNPRVVVVDTPQVWTSNGKERLLPVASVPQYREPLVVAFTSQFTAFRFRIAREVVVASVPVAFMKVNLLIMESTEVEVAKIEFEMMFPTTESLWRGVVVPIPMLPVERVLPAPSSPVPKIRLPMLRELVAVEDVAFLSWPMIIFLEPKVRLSPAA